MQETERMATRRTSKKASFLSFCFAFFLPAFKIKGSISNFHDDTYGHPGILLGPTFLFPSNKRKKHTDTPTINSLYQPSLSSSLISPWKNLTSTLFISWDLSLQHFRPYIPSSLLRSSLPHSPPSLHNPSLQPPHSFT